MQRSTICISAFLGANTPSQSFRRCRLWELPWGVLFVHIPWSYVLVMCRVKVFREIVRKVFLSWVPLYVELFVQDLSVTKKNRISVDRDRCFLAVLFAIPATVLLSQCTGVGGWRWPSSRRANHNTLPSLIFKHSAPSSASAAEQTTIRSMPQETNMFPFIWMFSPS